MNIKDLFPKKEFYVMVTEGKTGLETSVSSDIVRLNDAHKKLLIAFFEDIIMQLRK